MTALPANTYPNDASRTKGQMKQYEVDVNQVVREMPGGGPETEVELVSGAFTPDDNDGCFYVIDGEGSLADTLTNIIPTNCRDGHVIYIRIAGADITFDDQFGGAGSIFNGHAADFTLTDPKQFVGLKFKSTGSKWEIFAMSENIKTFPIDGVAANKVFGRASGTGQPDFISLVRGHFGTLFDLVPGWQARATETIVSNELTPQQFVNQINTGSAAQTVTDITTSGIDDGALILVGISSISNSAQLTHNASKIVTRDGSNIVMSALKHWVLLQHDGSLWREITRFGYESSGAVAGICQGRLTNVSGDPYRGAHGTSNTSSATLYFSPLPGGQVATFNGSAWSLNTFTEKSLSVADVKSMVCYDIFLVDGTLALEKLEWKSATASSNPSAGAAVVINIADTTGFAAGQLVTVANSAHSTVELCYITNMVTNTSITVENLQNSYTLPKLYPHVRATALVAQDGAWVKSGQTTRLYLGTIAGYAGDGVTTGTVETSEEFRGIWNFYNQRQAYLKASYSTEHTYTLATPRIFGNSRTLGDTNFLFVTGFPSNYQASVTCAVSSSTTGKFSLDLAKNSEVGGFGGTAGEVNAASQHINPFALINGSTHSASGAGHSGLPSSSYGIGLTRIQAVQAAEATGTMTWCPATSLAPSLVINGTIMN